VSKSPSDELDVGECPIASIANAGHGINVATRAIKKEADEVLTKMLFDDVGRIAWIVS
jgi:hypothetical protein